MPDAPPNPPRRRAWPLALKLSLDLLLAALVPLGVALWIATAQSRHALERAGEDSMRLLAQATAARLDQLITDASRASLLLARDDDAVALCAAPDAALAGLATERLRAVTDTNPDFASAFITGAQGVGIASTNPRNVGQDLNFREYIQRALAGETFISEFVVGKTTGEPGVYCSAPVLPPAAAPGAAPLGAAVIKLRGERIWEFIDDVRLGADGFAAIVDANGVVIAIPNRDLLYHSLGALTPERTSAIDPQTSYSIDRIESLDLAPLMGPATDTSPTGAVSYIAPKLAPQPGRHMVAGYAAMQARQWKVFVVQPQTQLEEASAALARRQGVVAIVVALLAGALALVRARTITRPVVELSDAANRLGDGDLTARAPVRSHDEIGRLAEAFNAMAPRLQEAMELRHSLAVAMEVQQSLLPAGDPTLSRLEIAGRSRYCDATGGDYYDFIDIAPIHPGATLIAVGDVMGHGIAAALLMASARAALRTRAMETGDLAALLERVNAVLSADRHERFMTLALAVIDADAGVIRWASAGHDPPMVLHAATRELEELDGGDIPLGIDGAYAYTEYTNAGLRPGDLVVIGTDGIWEAPAPDHSRFGKPRLKELLRAHVQDPVAKIAEAIENDIRTHRGAAAQEDDITFVIVRIR